MPGMIGALFVLTPLAVLAFRHPHGPRVLLAAAVYSVPAFFNTEIRFLLPAIPFICLGLGLALENSRGILPAVAVAEVVLCWPAVLDTYCDHNAWRVRGLPLRAALRLEPESQFIAAHVGDYALKDAIDRAVPAGTRIFSFAGRAAAYLDRDIVVGYESTEGMQVQESLEKAASADSGQREAAMRAKSAGMGFLLVDDSDSLARNVRDRSKIWGVTAVAKANETTLYRID